MEEDGGECRSGFDDSSIFTAIRERWLANIPTKRNTRLDGFQPARTDTELASLAHQLKTPIAIVSGYIEILLDGKLGSLNEEQRRILTDSAANCQRLKKFVDELLSKAALCTRQLEMHFDIRNINLCVEEVCTYWRDPYQRKGLALYFEPDQSLEAFAFDYDQMYRVISNLLGNALKFTPPDGSVWLTIQRAQIERGTGNQPRCSCGSAATTPDMIPAVKITVADTGPGIPAEYHTEIFREFFQIPNQKDNPEGTGLGLSIALQIIHAHGGCMWAESEGKEGTRICFVVPVRRQTELLK